MLKKTKTKTAFYTAFHYLCDNSGKKSSEASKEGHTEKRKSVYDIIPNPENRQFSSPGNNRQQNACALLYHSLRRSKIVTV